MMRIHGQPHFDFMWLNYNLCADLSYFGQFRIHELLDHEELCPLKNETENNAMVLHMNPIVASEELFFSPVMPLDVLEGSSDLLGLKSILLGVRLYLVLKCL